jgi:hypothetical protein
MWNRRANRSHFLHIPAGAFRPLADTVGYATRLADADADTALVVAHNHYGAEGEAPPTLDDFGDTLDVYYTLVEFLAVIVTLAFAPGFSFSPFFSHDFFSKP